ncbi:hypothetical protein BT96DRAFT_36676 [Gymnopus androsaceus JB14]|uniref:Uncharacterized protein n=1 Tax=Gymnopus androsaceus JB14 TaxID=1447944 RepID=A0A6A4HLU3_9AGAR|nr:hypothetical protein BT96DRAFT_36676 [Gymnopus androsaceus JB14]
MQAKRSDFSSKGAFYLTDRFRTAGQYVCNRVDHEEDAIIIEYKWTPAALANQVYEWPSKTPDWKDFCGVNLGDHYTAEGTNKGKSLKELQKWRDEILEHRVMISGPMGLKETTDAKLTDNFWQYALLDQEVADGCTEIELVKIHDPIPCSKFPAGHIGPTDTQGPSAGFSAAVKASLGIK